MAVLLPGISDSIHIRLFSAGYIELGNWWTHTDHIRNMWRLARVDSEGAALLHGSGRFVLPANRLALIPPGMDFTAALECKVKQFYVHFGVIGWPATSIQEIFPTPIALQPDAIRDQLTEELCNEVKKSDRLAPPLSCRVKSLVHLVMASLESDLPASKVAILRRIASGQLDFIEVLRFIDTHLEEPLSNRHLAKIAHTSESCFIRRFREAMGQTPARYVQERRVARASELLVCTEQSIDEVAQRCGFANRYYFSRVFSERMGRPPGRYRNERPTQN